MRMTFSKSFGYALRGILYIAGTGYNRPKVQLDEIANKLAVPKHFLGKIMKKAVKNGVLNSTKGPYGGYSLNDQTLSTPLIELAIITNSRNGFDDCVLHLDKCDADRPCPLHYQMLHYKKDVYTLFASTTIGDLINNNKQNPDDIISGMG
jgi:Rrf2 family protein